MRISRNYIHAVRTSKRMSQNRLADLAGLSTSTISRLESHGIDVGETAKARLLVALGIPLKSWRRVFPDLPFQPPEPSMPTGEEVAKSADKRRSYRNRQDRDRRRREKLWRDQEALKQRRSAE